MRAGFLLEGVLARLFSRAAGCNAQEPAGGVGGDEQDLRKDDASPDVPGRRCDLSCGAGEPEAKRVAGTMSAGALGPALLALLPLTVARMGRDPLGLYELSLRRRREASGAGLASRAGSAWDHWSQARARLYVLDLKRTKHANPENRSNLQNTATLKSLIICPMVISRPDRRAGCEPKRRL